MEMIPFENAIRTEWKTTNRKKLFQSMLNFFPQLTDDDKVEINTQMAFDNVDYLEVPHYENLKDTDPKMLLVFQGKRVFIDILNPLHEKELLLEINKLIDVESKFIKSRKMTTSEWKKRLQVMLQLAMGSDKYEDLDEHDDEDDVLSYNEDFYDDYNFSIPYDEDGVLNRTGFKLVAKDPVLKWLNETENVQKLNMHKITWTLDMINSEPQVFLIPVGLELETQIEQKRVWAKIRERAFYHFLESYYSDDDLWPEVTQKKFDQWFNIEQFGLIIDIADDL